MVHEALLPHLRPVTHAAHPSLFWVAQVHAQAEQAVWYVQHNVHARHTTGICLVAAAHRLHAPTEPHRNRARACHCHNTHGSAQPHMQHTQHMHLRTLGFAWTSSSSMPEGQNTGPSQLLPGSSITLPARGPLKLGSHAGPATRARATGSMPTRKRTADMGAEKSPRAEADLVRRASSLPGGGKEIGTCDQFG